MDHNHIGERIDGRACARNRVLPPCPAADQAHRLGKPREERGRRDGDVRRQCHDDFVNRGWETNAPTLRSRMVRPAISRNCFGVPRRQDGCPVQPRR